MLPRRVFKTYWCSIQYPYLKLSGQNRPQSLVFCKSSTWDSFVHPALSTIPVKYRKNFTSPKTPPKPQAILPYASDSVISLLSLSLPSQDFQCALWNLCLYWLSFLYPLPLWFFILQSSSKQNTNAHGTSVFLFASNSKNVFLLRISGRQTSLPATLPWYCHSIFLEVFSHQSRFSFSSCPYYHLWWCQCLCWSLYSVIFILSFYPPTVQLSSVAQSCPTLCDSMNRSTPGLPVHHQLPESTQSHGHRVGDAIQPSHPLSPPSPPALNLSQHQSLFKWVSSSHQC